MTVSRKIPCEWRPQIAAEYVVGMSGSGLAQKYGVGSTRTIYPIVQKYRKEQANRCVRSRSSSHRQAIRSRETGSSSRDSRRPSISN